VHVSVGGIIHLYSTLLGDNAAHNAPDCSAPISSVSAEDSLLENGEGSGLVNGETGNIVGRDPRLGPLQDNGGLAWTHALLPDSPAIDAGDNEYSLETDQRGRPRVVNGRADIGAFEFIPSPRRAPPAPLAVPRPALVASLSRRRGKTWVRFVDARTGAVWLQLRFADRVLLAQDDINGDGVGDFVLHVGKRRRRRWLVFSGLHLARLPA
jgi:hypothetical protein